MYPISIYFDDRMYRTDSDARGDPSEVHESHFLNYLFQEPVHIISLDRCCARVWRDINVHGDFAVHEEKQGGEERVKD